jgi:uncharacterized protein
MPNKKVVVVGASARPEKYSYQAVSLLHEFGYEPIPVHPSGKSVLGFETKKDLSEVNTEIDTITLYVGPQNSEQLSDKLLALHPRRIIMNPGAENEALKQRATRAGVEVVEGCTLVMLKTGQF